MRKKAQSVAVAAILVLAIILILVIWMTNTQKKIDDSQRTLMCAKTIDANAQARMGAHVFADNIKCPPRLINITDTENKVIVKKIADELVECKDLYIGESGKELFEGDNVFCAPCAVIDFETDKPITGFYRYLEEENVPGKDVNYMDYLQLRRSDTAIENLEGYNLHNIDQVLDADIDPSKTYSIVFVHARGESFIKDMMQRASTTSGTVFGVGTAGAVAGGVVLYAAGLTNPVGWVILGTSGLVAGSAAVYNYFFEEGEPTQWMSLIFLKEYDENMYSDLSCQVLPVEQGNI